MNAINPTQLKKSIRFYYLDRMLRGGSWYNGAWHARASDRNRNDPSDRDDGLGFRLVRNR